jgi:hypothetical protein
MKRLLQLVSWLALLGGIVTPPLFFLGGRLGEGMLRTGMLVGTIAWFATAPFWMNQDQGG